MKVLLCPKVWGFWGEGLAGNWAANILGRNVRGWDWWELLVGSTGAVCKDCSPLYPLDFPVNSLSLSHLPPSCTPYLISQVPAACYRCPVLLGHLPPSLAVPFCQHRSVLGLFSSCCGHAAPSFILYPGSCPGLDTNLSPVTSSPNPALWQAGQEELPAAGRLSNKS